MHRIISLMKNEFKQRYNYAVITISLLIFHLLLLALSDQYCIVDSYIDNQHYSFFIDIVFYSLLILNSFILPNLIFRYLYKPGDSPYVSSLPYRKNEVFISKYLVGICIGYLPLVIYLVFVLLVGNKTTEILSMVYITTIIFFFYYHLGCLASVLCGKKSLQIVLTTAFYFVPIVVYYAFMSLVTNMVVGTVNTELSIPLLKYLFPLFPGILNLGTFGVELWNGFSWYLIVAVVLLILTLLINHFRKVEFAGEATINKQFTFVVKHVIIVVVSLVFGSFYFYMLNYSTITWYLVSLGIVMIIVSYIVEVLFTGNKRAISIYKTMVPVFIVLAIGAVNLKNYYTYQIPTAINELSIEIDSFGREIADYTVKKEDYQLIRELHKELIDLNVKYYNHDIAIDNISFRISIRYQLNNGSVISRIYLIPETLLSESMTPLLEEKAYRESYYEQTYELIKNIDTTEFFNIVTFNGEGELNVDLNQGDLSTFAKRLDAEIKMDINNEVDPLSYYLRENSLYLISYVIDENKNYRDIFFAKGSPIYRAILAVYQDVIESQY